MIIIARLCWLTALIITTCLSAWTVDKPARASFKLHGNGQANPPPALLLKAGEDIVGQVYLAYDTDNCYLRYQIIDNSPLKNCGDDWTMLFKTGDSVDLQLGLNPQAPADRTIPAEGDIRLLLTKTPAGLTAVLYRYKVPGTETPVEYGSPTGHVTVDRVEQIKPESIAMAGKIMDDGYELSASIPWELLAGKACKMTAGTMLRGDAGVLFSDPDGGITVERIYWANKDTAIVADIPSEIRLFPAKWGELLLDPAKKP